MAHLWSRSTESPPGAATAGVPWTEQRLDDLAAFDLGGMRGAGQGETPGAARIIASNGQWVLLAPPAARVAINGAAAVGVRVLVDRDEISSADFGRVYFSTECPPALIAFPLTDTNARCPRCRQPIEPGSPSVRCHCGSYYHQTEALPCYTYAPCAVCGAATSLDGSYLWTPEHL